MTITTSYTEILTDPRLGSCPSFTRRPRLEAADLAVAEAAVDEGHEPARGRDACFVGPSRSAIRWRNWFGEAPSLNRLGTS